MPNLYELYVTLGLDKSEFDKGITEAKKETLNFSNSVKSVFAGSLLANFAQQAAQAAFQFAGDAIEIASDLAEVQNVVDVTFGNGASQIDSWAKAAKTAFGMGELNAKRFAGTMGAMLKSMGMTDAETMDMSTNLVKLAGDMASFYNLDHETAFEKIRSGISGETEPLKQLGINMSVVNLEAFAMSQGIDKAYSSMTQAEQASLRYNYLLQTTAGAQGDFARTAGSYANQLKLFGENINEIKAGMGESLLDFVSPALTTFNEWYANLSSDNVEEQLKDVEQGEIDELENADLKAAKVSSLIDKIEELGQKSELSEMEMRTWEGALRELVALFPELAGSIDLTNFSIKTTTDELRQNTQQAWKSAREMAMINALKGKEQIRMNAIQAAADAELAYLMQQGVADAAMTALYDNYTKKIRERYGEQYDEVAQVGSLDEFLSLSESDFNLLTAHFNAIGVNQSEASEALSQATKLKAEFEAAKKSADMAIDAYDEQHKSMQDVADAYEQNKKASDDAAKAQDDYKKYLDTELVTLTNLADAWKKVSEYRTTTQENMAASFERGTDDLWSAIVTAEQMKELMKEIKNPMDAAQKTLVENTAFYTQYNAGLQAAIERGLDSNLIAELAQNQTAENKLLLDYILGGASEEEITSLNSAWANLGTAKDALATTMTDAVLIVDEGYQAMLDAAYEATESIDQYEIAQAAAAHTGEGVVDGLDSVVWKIQEKVEQINGIINQIGVGGIQLDFGINGSGDGGGGAAAVLRDAVREGMNGVSVTVNAQAVGNAVAPYVSRYVAQEAVVRRFNV